MLQSIMSLAASALLACQIITPVQQINNNLSQSASINIVALGDSNTAGNPGYGVNSVDTSLTYPALIGAENQGVNGNRVSQVYSRLQTSLFSKKKTGSRNMATLLIGINDFNQGYSVEDTWQDFKTLANAITSNGWELTVMTYFPKLNDDLVTGKVLELNQLIRANRGKYQVLDLYYHIASRPELMAPDGLHLNQNGHKKVADLIGSRKLKTAKVVKFK